VYVGVVLAVLCAALLHATWIVRWASTQAPLALVAAVWEVSTVVAVLFGVLLLKEKLNWRKAMSVFVTLSGTILLRASK
jgi:multidrug transporter EmrE-like cation transporter